MNDPLFVGAGLSSNDPKGTFQVVYGIPSDNTLVGLAFLTQMIWADPGANAMGLTTSRGLQQGIGRGTQPGGRITRICGLNNPNATTGRKYMNGLVTMFHN